MDIKIGLHDWISVTLTERGAAIVNKTLHPDHHYEAGEEYEGTVAQIMHEFGVFMFDGCDTPFEDETIRIYCQSYRDLRNKS